MKTTYGQFFEISPEINYLLGAPSFIAVRPITGKSCFEEGRDSDFLDCKNWSEVQHLVQSFSHDTKFTHD